MLQDRQSGTFIAYLYQGTGKMNLIQQQSGFTLTEIIVALLIMVLGFLAMSQMQFLSLRQHRLADQGTVGTNSLQALSERDMAEIRRIHLLNSRVYLDGQSGKLITTQDDYCSGSVVPCDSGCPCNPFIILTSDTGSDNTETSCAEIDIKDVDPTNVQYETSKSSCADADLYIVRRVITNVDTSANPTDITVNVTYAIKNPQQFEDYTFGNQLTLPNSVVVQNYTASAHVDDWSTYIPGWNQVIVPHIP